MDALANTSTPTSSVVIPFLLIFAALAHIIPYLTDPLHLRRYPGPLLARLSDVWLAWHCARGTINRAVLAAHRTYGPIVRISPTQISVADVSALQPVYGHGSGAPKSDIYDAFSGLGIPSIFTTRSREEHTRKRKALAHTFALKTVLEFEPVVRDYLGSIIRNWDRMCKAAARGEGGTIGEMTWISRGGCAVFDTLKWYNFMVFDIIGDLVFRAPFGMTERATEMALIAKRRDKAIESYETSEQKLEYNAVPAVQAINKRGTFLLTIGMLPQHWRPLLKKLPLSWFTAGHAAAEMMLTLAITAVAHRSQHTAARNDILGKYMEARDDRGQQLDNKELSSEALTLLIGGTDTTSNSAAALTFYLAQNPTVQTKLQRELDVALGKPAYEDEDAERPALVEYELIKNLPYLQDVVNEGLRLFSTIGIGLPRVVPEGGLRVLGEAFSPGAVVSVPTYVTHHDEAIWGEDSWAFNPDRWQTGDKSAMAKAFVPFSLGPRACIGRNLALMELLLVVANVFHRFEARLADPDQTMEITDAFLRKPVASVVALRRRGGI